MLVIPGMSVKSGMSVIRNVNDARNVSDIRNISVIEILVTSLTIKEMSSEIQGWLRNRL